MDPLWYKDAVIYQLHVRSFFDSDSDGFGDFEGMRQKLPYLESLGINTIWLLPFYESPLRDDGYDVADYLKILPVHGTVDQFKRFLDEAHERGMRVLTEMVLNHTSDQHPWFQESRRPGSAKRDWYVWSETSDRYKGVRIIFQDFEPSNWTWDPVANAYYWHRFFSHQPDLNWDNPEVEQALHEAVFYWLDMGVDGLRLDAIPYLCEEEGTSCENLPQTLAAIKRLRAAIDARYSGGRVLLAEANMWPEETIPYFGDGDGDGVQMAFNFPIMPRLFMALRREDRRPIVEMLQLTDAIPPDCQWVLFLRNHDELTLEMVTDEERDYMYGSYAADPQYRINLGIRRRLYPLLGGERRRVELLTALLLSLRGSPVLYYGDEIGMGDNPFLGDRNGVRTPMQWSSDRNAGFSRAPFARLFLPPISDGRYSYHFLNVEAQNDNPHSLLNFNRRILAMRSRYARVFGRGSMRVLDVANPKVLAFVREHEDQRVLVVANLSRFAQALAIPLEDAIGYVPIEAFSRDPFPTITERDYPVMLAPHGFYWFELTPPVSADSAQAEGSSSELPPRALPTLSLSGGLESVLVDTLVQGDARERLEGILPSFLSGQRWFASRGSERPQVRFADAVRLAAGPSPLYLALVDAKDDHGSSRYLLPLTLSLGEKADQVMRDHSRACIARVRGTDESAVLHDATVLPSFWQALTERWGADWQGRSLKGRYAAKPLGGCSFPYDGAIRVLSAEQSNTSAIVGNVFLKLYRRVESGPNPEVEMLRALSDAGFQFVPKLLGTLTFHWNGKAQSLGVSQRALEIDSDSWDHALTEYRKFLERVIESPLPQSSEGQGTTQHPGWLEGVGKDLVQMARSLGVRTAELHSALCQATEPDLAPVPMGPDDIQRFAAVLRREMADTRARLVEAKVEVPADTWARAANAIERLADVHGEWMRIRVHGDLHLGQIAYAKGDFFLLDFEGEPDRPLHERRERDQAFRDVAGMLRSLEYAGLVALAELEDTQSGKASTMEAWVWTMIRWSKHVFLDAYLYTSSDQPFLPPVEQRAVILEAYLLHKVLYETRYELGHRPAWVWMPLSGLDRLLTPATDQG